MPFEGVQVYARDGGFVADLFIPLMKTPPEIVAWESRVFTRRDDGRYVEGLLVVGHTREDLARPHDVQP